MSTRRIYTEQYADRDALELIEEEEKKRKNNCLRTSFETLEEAEAECKAQDERMNGYY